jgi:hypothetical protein
MRSSDICLAGVAPSQINANLQSFNTNGFNPMTDLHPNSQQIREIIEQAGSTFVRVKFIKKDGSEREITFNPKDYNEVKGTGKASSNPNTFRIREVQNKETGKTVWRSFDGTRVLRISAKGRTLNFDVVGDS